MVSKAPKEVFAQTQQKSSLKIRLSTKWTPKYWIDKLCIYFLMLKGDMFTVPNQLEN